ncbi:MAG: hypothetical protein IID52_08925, partial [Proteobacteria bacterium]|nr:hypothetical protein [Pseudomonadota bacterium]
MEDLTQLGLTPETAEDIQAFCVLAARGDIYDYALAQEKLFGLGSKIADVFLGKPRAQTHEVATALTTLEYIPKGSGQDLFNDIQCESAPRTSASTHVLGVLGLASGGFFLFCSPLRPA